MTIKKNNIFIAICTAVILFIFAFIFTSCSQEGTQYNKSVKDVYGREVKLPDTVNKIATIGSATRICVYAGATNKLIAITEADRPSELRPYTIANEDKLSKLPTTNNGNHLNEITVDKEKLMELKPDVIISSRSKDDCQKLQDDTKIPVIGASFQDCIFDGDLYNSIKIVGEVANTQEHAKKTIQYLDNCKNELNNKTNGKQTNNKAYRGAINYKGSKGITGTISNYCVYKAINIKNVADKDNMTSAYDTTEEQILNWNPNYIFTDCTNTNKVKNNIQNNPSVYSQIDAYKNNKMYSIGPFNNNGTNVEYGICEAYFTAKILFPEQFKDIDIEKKIEEIINVLDGSSIYKQLRDKGIYFGSTKL